jgi:hypothetical protein
MNDLHFISYIRIPEQPKCRPVGEDEHHGGFDVARGRPGDPLPPWHQHEETTLVLDQPVCSARKRNRTAGRISPARKHEAGNNTDQVCIRFHRFFYCVLFYFFSSLLFRLSFK